MSRNSLIRPRRYRAVSDRPATGTRLFPSPFPPNIPLHIPHYKRCPKAHRLRLRSDQSLSLPVYVTGYGRFPDKKRLALSKGQCQVRAALNRRIRFASSGDAPEHSVMSPPRAIVPPWAIAPCSDSHGLDLAGQSEQSDERRLKTNAPFLDAAVAALAGQSEQSDERRLKTNAPFLDSTVVTTGELPTTNAGHGSPLPSLRDGRALLVVETAPPRDFLASPPHPPRSSGLSQSRRRCGTSAVAENAHRYRRSRLPAQTSGTFHPFSLCPAPSIQGKADFSRKTIRPHAWVCASIKTPPFIPPKGSRPTAHTLNPSPHN